MINKNLMIGIILIFVLFLSGCVGESNYIIRVTANPGLEYSGSYLVMSSGGNQCPRP